MFRFKQFSVAHDKCAMKVNTDGVLLGAWAGNNPSAFCRNPKQILDIGTGTGVIALMMAQQFPDATVDAIDIDKDACEQAKENFERSNWSHRLRTFHSSLQEYQPERLYDIIISNPPYFIDDQKSGNQQRDTARHSVALTYSELLHGIGRLLTETGSAFVVIPAFNLELVEDIAAEHGMFAGRQTEVIAVEGRKPYLELLRLERIICKHTIDNIVIQKGAAEFTEQYKQLTKEFYLKF